MALTIENPISEISRLFLLKTPTDKDLLLAAEQIARIVSYIGFVGFALLVFAFLF